MVTLNKLTAGKTAKNIGMSALLLFGLLFTSCEKKGPAGPAGKDGTNGNANVVSSTITSSNWVYNAPSWSISFSYAAITQDIIDRGAVLVYMKVGSSYSQLPVTIYPSSSYSSTFEVGSSVGLVTILRTDSDLTQPNNPGSNTFKIVVIAASQLIKNPNVNLDNYQEVKAAFNLQD